MSKILKTMSMDGNLYDVSGRIRHFNFANNTLTECEGISYNLSNGSFCLLSSNTPLEKTVNPTEIVANLADSTNRVYFLSGNDFYSYDLVSLTTSTSYAHTKVTAKNSFGAVYTISAVEYIPHPQKNA